MHTAAPCSVVIVAWWSKRTGIARIVQGFHSLQGQLAQSTGGTHYARVPHQLVSEALRLGYVCVSYITSRKHSATGWLHGVAWESRDVHPAVSLSKYFLHCLPCNQLSPVLQPVAAIAF